MADDTQAQWSAVKALFQGAMSQEPSQRRAFVEGHCDGDAEILSEVLALLQHGEVAGEFLENSARDMAAALVSEGSVEESADEVVGQRLGPYRVDRELAQGGMGTVFLASRADGQFDHQVAIKVLKRGLDTIDVHARFIAERQILAGLKHPNIARLLDGGVTPDGRPYLVMEYVDGTPLTEYVSDKNPSLAQRIGLFRSVCAAVHAAHQSLVLHRDIKPSNILVQGDGTVKLLDFGIARVLEHRAGTAEPPTRAEGRYLTLAYASPEQIQGHSLTTAADVYSLGVLLYELLVGKRPFETGDLARSEAEEMILKKKPIAPSLHADSIEAPKDRVTSLKGDLDTIIMMALRKDPSQRYSTVHSFSEDLRRHLVGLPVIARGDALVYRARKFVLRHRFAVAAATLLVASIIGGAGGLALYTVEIGEERDKAREVTRFLVDVFEGADPWHASGDSLPARALLDRGAERVASQLGTQPEVRATLLDALGQVYHGLGILDEAETHLRAAVDLRRTYAPSGPEISETLNHLGVLLDAKGSYDEAQALLEEALERRREMHKLPHAAVAESANNLGQLLLYVRRDILGAEALLEEALTMRRTLFEPPHLDLAVTLHNVGLLRQLQGRLRESLPYYEESRDMRRELFGEFHPAFATTQNNLALVRHQLGDYAEAEPLYRASLAARIAGLGPAHSSVSLAKGNLALLLYDRGDYQASEPLSRDAVAGMTASLGERHPRTATLQNNLADLLRETGRMEEAQVLYSVSLATRRATLGPDHPHVAYSLNGLGRMRRLQGDFVAADSLLSQALAARQASLGPDHPDVSETLYQQGLLRLDMGETREAVDLLSRALDVRTKVFSEEHPAVADTQVALAQALRILGETARAAALAESAFAIRSRVFPAGHRKLQEARGLLAEG